MLLLVAVPAIQPVSDPDFFWHLQVGNWILSHHAIPRHDLFTFTVADHAFIAHEWLSEVIIAAVTSLSGLGGVALFFGAITWLGFLVLLATPRGVGYVIGGLALVIGVAAGNPIWGPRTQMLTFALLCAELLALRRYRESGDRRWLYPLPPMFLLWANLHAGFTAGLGVFALYIAGEWLTRRFGGHGNPPATVPALRPLLLTGLASLLIVVINPNFFGLYIYAAQTQFSPAQQQLIVEWQSPNFHMLEVRAYEGMLLLLVALLALSHFRIRLTDLLLLLAGIVLSLQSVRHIAIFVAIATPLLAELGQAGYESWRDRLRLREPPHNVVFGVANLTIIFILAVIVFVATAPGWSSNPRSKAVRRDYPVAALDHIAADPPPGNLFNQYGWGGYLVYRLWPLRQVYIYGDAAVMGDAFLREYEAIQNLHPDYSAILQRRQVAWVIFPRDAPLEVVLRDSPDWVVVYHDRLASVLVRRSPQTRAYLGSHGFE